MVSDTAKTLEAWQREMYESKTAEAEILKTYFEFRAAGKIVPGVEDLKKYEGGMA